MQPYLIPKDQVSDEKIKYWVSLIHAGKLTFARLEEGQYQEIPLAESCFGQSILLTAQARELSKTDTMD